MDTKHIHCMLEKMAEYGKCMIEEGAGSGSVKLDDAGKIVDMVKDLACAEKDALIAKEMRKAHEDEETEEKYMRKMLKEENKDEFKHYMEEYGDDGERRFYDDYRYKRSGRFAPKGKGSYMPRRGYEEMPYMMPEIYNPIEYYRDMDRMDGKMYYSGGGQSSGGNTGGQSGQSSGGSSSGGMSGNMGSNTRGYEEGYSDGNRRGYEEGYRQGSQSGKGSSNYDNARRGYSEGKQEHKGNTPEDNTENMRNLEKLLGVVGGDIRELKPGMSQQEKAMTAQKLETWARELKQA